MLKQGLLLGTVTLFLVSCAHYPDVRPSSDGPHKVVLQMERKNEGFKEAFSQAKDFCDDVYEKRAVHIKDQSKYVGTMDEAEYNRYKTASEVIGAVGGAAAVFGGKNERKAGAVGAVGGGIADNALGKAYEFTLWFKCE